MAGSEHRGIVLGYLLTFTCYGARLHGDELGSVDREHNVPGTPYASPDAVRLTSTKERMIGEPFRLDATRRGIVLAGIQTGCERRAWDLLAVHVRSNHVHVVLAAEEKPAKILEGLKAYASRALNRTWLDRVGTRRWTRHGSTRYLWKDSEVEASIDYVVRGQGETMAVFEKLGRGRWAEASTKN